MNEYKVNVCFEKNKIITALSELVQNDYNSTKLKFAFDKNGSRFLFKLKYPDNTVYVDEIVNNELILGAGVLNQSGYYQYEISMYDTDNRLTDYAIGQIYVRNEVVSTDEIVEPDDRVPILDNLINEVNSIDIDAEKVDDTTTITLNKKDGTQKTIEINDGIDGIDGIGLNYNWVSTSLGIKREDEQEYQYVNLKGDKGDAGAIKMVIVNELPQTGSDDTIYLVPLENPDISGNNYAEYVWINNAWELLGKIGVQVDLTDYYTKQETYSKGEVNALIPSLTDYVKNTDYATSSVGGVLLISSSYGTDVHNGTLRGISRTYEQYSSDSSRMLISKSTLENVIVGKDLTTKAYVDGLVGDIGTILDSINGESVGA